VGPSVTLPQQRPGELPEQCPRCKSDLAPAALVCSACHALVHSSKLEQLSESARLHEQRREYPEARSDWAQALELLPPDSTQAEWIRNNLNGLEKLAGAAQTNPKHAWARKFGPFAPLIILLANGKFLLALFKLKFLLSLWAFVAFYWAIYGARFGIGFAALILLHEMGHFIEIKRRGLPAEMPVFLPGLGAYVRWTALGVSTQTRAFISLAGPMAGCLAAAACALLWMKTGDALWIGLASVSAMLNVLNLIPIWVLDGSQAIIALNKTERIVLSAAAVLFAAYFSQPLFLLVAVGAAYRIFTKDVPQAPSHAATAYYLIVLVVLGYLISLAPLPASGAR
jgi:Zn-dependent protease